MFRSLARARRTEKDEDFQDLSSFTRSQTNVFNTQLPNQYPTTLATTSASKPQDILRNASNSLITFDPNTRQPLQSETNLSAYATSVEISQELQDAQQRCKTATLDDLINTQAPNSKIRCGWIYSKGKPGDQPKVSTGALGTRQGPAGFFQNPGGQWFWNLEDAKKAMDGDRCAAMTNCKSVGDSKFQGCAYSTTRGIGVPVNPDGTLAYPRDAVLSAPPSSLVTTPDKCPAPPAPGSPRYELQRSRDLCTPLPDGRLSRDCMLQQIMAAGCKQDGSLYQALINQAQPTNYAAGLNTALAYRRYQQLAANPLLEAAVRDGKTTVDVALGTFKNLAEASKDVQETVLSYAARDLCVSKGTIDTFDFCLELNDNSRAPFSLSCLQTEFRKAGGQPAGSEYPTSANMSQWNALETWRAVKDRIGALAAQTKSSDEIVQRRALANFLGIRRQPQAFQQIPRIPGLEVLWFNRGTNTFIGRRTGLLNSTFPSFSTSGEVDGTGLRDFVEYFVITNVRPTTDLKIRMRLETDDGIIFTLNREVNSRSTRGTFIDTADTFGANFDQAPTGYNQKTCWDLKSAGPNYVMGFWQESGGHAHSQISYAPCNGGGFQPFPNEWLSLTQEPDAPLFSWQGLRSADGVLGFNERRMPSTMGIAASPQTTVVAQTAATGIGNLDAVLQLKQNGNGFGQVARNIAMNSWRTFTMLFSTNSRVANGKVLDFGPLQISITNGKLAVSWSSATLMVNTNTQPLSWTIPTTGRNYYYVYVNMRSDMKNQYPNRLTLSFAAASEYLAGRVSVANMTGNTASFTTSGSAPLYNVSDAAILYLGDRNTVATADINVAFARLFDYELDDTDVGRDIGNKWLMRFM
jgi:hypothetical protein